MAKSYEASNEYFWVADQLSAVSSAVVDFRIANYKTLDLSSRLALENIEHTLDTLVRDIRLRGIGLIGSQTDAARTELLKAADAAQAFLRRIDNIKAAIKVGAEVVMLAQAVLTMDVQAIINTAGDVIKTATK